MRGPPPVGRTAVIFVTILGLFLVPFRDKIAATSDQMRFLAGKCSKMRLRPGLRPGPRWGSLQRSLALPTCLLLTHVALCQRVRGVIARTRYINLLTDLLTSVVLLVVQILVLIGLYFLKCTKFDQLIPRKIIKIVATRCQILTLECTKIDFG